MKKTTKIGLISSFWDAARGEHPSLVTDEQGYFSFPPVLDDDVEEHLLAQDLPLIPCVDGHNVMVETGVSGFLDIDIKFCLSPNFVKDMAGRIIYIGYGPEKKDSTQWRLNRNVSFPRHCRPVTPNIEGHELIEEVFFARFRCLETSVEYEDFDHQIRLSYPSANLYPYKLRVDSFYQDGWRLPQTEMLFVNFQANSEQAEKYGQDILKIWEQMQNAGLTYADFYDKLESSGAIEKMFVGGCTLIPTFEATNGFFDVNDDFTINKQHSGRAVEGLHVIEGHKTSLEPEGTILEVVEPGYMTPERIQPAKVIVSDGQRYNITQKAKGMAQYPDLTLPHTRCSAVWKSTWIPTEPHHFAAPSIWGWGDQTGHFLQTKGPLWDPLHYYYESVDRIVNSFQTNMVEGSRTLAYVPNEMKNRFYPAAPMRGFDMMSYKAKDKATEQDARPRTGLVRISDRKAHCNIGYHPLPISFEYELSYWNFPEMAPQKRVKAEEKPSVNICPIIQVSTTETVYKNRAQDVNEFNRLQMPAMMAESTGRALEDYPQLNRYLGEYNDNLAKTAIQLTISAPEEAPKPQGSLIELSNDIGIDFYKEVYKMREKGVQRLTGRNKTIDTAPDQYIEQEWNM